MYILSILHRGKKVIYIYHNDIDGAGHDSAGESKVFVACDEAIKKLVVLGKVLIGVRPSCRIIVTSDHGFLYNYKKLDEANKLSVKSDVIVDAIGEKRCIVATDKIESDVLLPVKLLINNATNSLYGYAPYQTIRLKANGGASNYVHGGLSLEEMMIPVVLFDSIRNDSKAFEQNKDKYEHAYVKLCMISKPGILYNLNSKFDFYQKDPISSKANEARFEVYMEDSNGNKISDVSYIEANKTDLDQANRTFKVIINIKPDKYNSDNGYFLVVMNSDSHEIEIREEFGIHNEFGGDFDL